MDTFFANADGIFRDQELIAVFPEIKPAGYKDSFKAVGSGIYKWSRTFDLNGLADMDYINLQMDLMVCENVNYYMIPGVNYNGNHWGNGREPKGHCFEGQPWIFGYHRSTVPAAMFCRTDHAAIGIWACIEKGKHYSCSMNNDKSGDLHMILHYPEKEGPVVYCARDRYEDPYQESAVHQGGEIVLEAVLVICERERGFAYGEFLEAAWNYYRADAGPEIMDKRMVWESGLSFIRERAYFEENNFSGFCMGLTWQENEWYQKRDYLEIGWVGQNASLAVSLIYQSVMEQSQELLDRGLKVLDGWLMHAVVPNGLFRCRFDLIQKFWDQPNNQEERNDAANLYSVIEEYLAAYKILKEIGIIREEYAVMVQNLCDFIVRQQKKSGKLGKAWYNDGSLAEADGTIGCYLAKGLCIAYEFFGIESYLDTATKAFYYYYQEFERDGFTTAGALDTCCIDKESAIPLLGTALMLYKFTNDTNYIDKAVQVSNYLATWQYHYNVDFSDSNILGQIGYRTRGGTAVSTQHHHIDCYGLEFYEDWMKLGELTGIQIWKDRASAVWSNSLYNISDGNLIIKGQRRPKGSQDEGFLQTRWHTKKGDYFGVSEWLVVWNSAFRLKILRKELLEEYLARTDEFSKEENSIQ